MTWSALLRRIRTGEAHFRSGTLGNQRTFGPCGWLHAAAATPLRRGACRGAVADLPEGTPLLGQEVDGFTKIGGILGRDETESTCRGGWQ